MLVLAVFCKELTHMKIVNEKIKVLASFKTDGTIIFYRIMNIINITKCFRHLKCPHPLLVFTNIIPRESFPYNNNLHKKHLSL